MLEKVCKLTIVVFMHITFKIIASDIATNYTTFKLYDIGYFKYTQSELKSTPDDSKISKQADHTCKQQPPSPKAVVKLLLDLHDKEELTTNQIKDQNEVLNTLIKVCVAIFTRISFASVLYKIQGPVYGFTEEEQLDKAAQVMVGKQ